nr:RNA-directed DNA polymerase, eukaryota, reverse transcriptase zinc-binding domain protein [Tanacetum cinerariifolium]
SFDDVCEIIREHVRLRLLSLKIRKSKQSLEATKIWNFHVLQSDMECLGEGKSSGYLGGNYCYFLDWFVIRSISLMFLGLNWWSRSCFAIMGWVSFVYDDYFADMDYLEEQGGVLIFTGPSVIFMWLGSFLKIDG